MTKRGRARLMRMIGPGKPFRSQRELAGLADVTEATMSRIISGTRIPSLTLATKLEDLTGIASREFVSAA